MTKNKIKLLDKISNLFVSNERKIVGYCKYCKNPFFNRNTKWRKQEMCINCFKAEERVREEYKVKMYYD